MDVVTQVMNLAGLVLGGTEVSGRAALENVASMAGRFAAGARAASSGVLHVVALGLEAANREVHRQRLATRIEVAFERARLDAGVAGGRVAAEAEQRTVPGDDLAVLDLEYEVLQRQLRDRERAHAPAERDEEAKIAAQAGLVVPVLLLEMLRLQEHSLSPEDRA